MPKNRTQLAIRILSIFSISTFICFAQTKNVRHELIGKWKIELRYVLCNICSEVDFNIDSTGSLKSGSNPRGEFRWGILDSTISLKFYETKKKERQILETGTYTIRFGADEDPQAIHLVTKDGKSTYVLTGM